MEDKMAYYDRCEVSRLFDIPFDLQKCVCDNKTIYHFQSYMKEFSTIYGDEKQLTDLQDFYKNICLLKGTQSQQKLIEIQDKLQNQNKKNKKKMKWIEKTIKHAILHIIPCHLRYLTALLSRLITYKNCIETQTIETNVLMDNELIFINVPFKKAPWEALDVLLKYFKITCISKESTQNGCISYVEASGTLTGVYEFYESERFISKSERPDEKPVYWDEDYFKHKVLELKNVELMANNKFALYELHRGSCGNEVFHSFGGDFGFEKGWKGILLSKVQTIFSWFAWNSTKAIKMKSGKIKNSIDWNGSVGIELMQIIDTCFSCSERYKTLRNSGGILEIIDETENIRKEVYKEVKQYKLELTKKSEWNYKCDTILYVALMEMEGDLTDAILAEISKKLNNCFDSDTIIKKAAGFGVFRKSINDA